MNRSTLIGVRHVSAAGRQIPVILTRNLRGTVSGQCFLDHAERPILDAPCVADVLRLIEDTVELLLMARGVSTQAAV